MEIITCTDYEALSSRSAEIIRHEIEKKPNLLLCAATGASPLGTYRKLVKQHKEDPILHSGLRVIKLDEWGGIPMDDPQSCETFLQRELVIPLDIQGKNYMAFDSDPADREAECARIGGWLRENGPVDCCVLGLGRNGHIGFNEPGDSLSPFSHVATLSGASMKHPMAREMKSRPSFGLSLGMADILGSRLIIMLVTGEGKDQAARGLFSGKVTTALPASFLWLHSGVVCLVDQGSVRDRGRV